MEIVGSFDTARLISVMYDSRIQHDVLECLVFSWGKKTPYKDKLHFD